MIAQRTTGYNSLIALSQSRASFPSSLCISLSPLPLLLLLLAHTVPSIHILMASSAPGGNIYVDTVQPVLCRLTFFPLSYPLSYHSQTAAPLGPFDALLLLLLHLKAIKYKSI